MNCLYVEYSENNFRLTRCKRCGQVADKYVEYELMLVLIDIILHRRPAFRHLMYNRYSWTVTSVSMSIFAQSMFLIRFVVFVVLENSKSFTNCSGIGINNIETNYFKQFV